MDASLPVRVTLSTRERGFLRVLAEARRNALAIIPALCLKQPIVSGKVVRRFHMVQDPESLRMILRDRVDQYPKSPEVGAILRPAIGHGLFTSDGGDHWRWQRRAAAPPVFSRRNVETLGPVMTRAAQAVSARLDAALDGTPPDAEIDMADQMLLTAFDVIGQVCFSHNDGIPPHDLARRAIERYLAGGAGRVSLFDFLGLPEWVPRPARMVVGRDLKRLKTAAVTAIEARRNMQVDSPDLLDMLMASQDPPDTGRRMTTEELRDNVLTFLVAGGHETTALALSWSLYLLAFDPAIQAARAPRHATCWRPDSNDRRRAGPALYSSDH